MVLLIAGIAECPGKQWVLEKYESESISWAKDLVSSPIGEWWWRSYDGTLSL